MTILMRVAHVASIYQLPTLTDFNDIEASSFTKLDALSRLTLMWES